MSLATLKKKTAHKYNNNSTQMRQFSLNGTHRSSGYIGQTSLSRTNIKTHSYGPIPQGHGGCCGTYKKQVLCPSSTFSTEDTNIVKPSVLGTKGMLQKRLAWARRPQPYVMVAPSNSLNQKSSSDYLIYKRKKVMQECENVNNEEKTYPNKKDIEENVGITCCAPKVKETKDIKTALSQGEYVFRLIDKCANLDISYIEYNMNANGVPQNICG